MFGYEIWYEGSVVREDDGFDTEFEALEDATDVIKYDLCEEWEDVTEDDFEIVLK